MIAPLIKHLLTIEIEGILGCLVSASATSDNLDQTRARQRQMALQSSDSLQMKLHLCNAA